MKKRLACLLAGICTLASAELVVKNLPPSLERPLQGSGLLAAEMDAQGVLHLRSKKATISELDYNNFVMHGLCSEQWRDPARLRDSGKARNRLKNRSCLRTVLNDFR